MVKILKLELIIFIGLLAFFTFAMHPDIFSDPMVRLAAMQQKSNYTHPLLYTFFVYLILFFLRAIISLATKFFRIDK